MNKIIKVRRFFLALFLVNIWSFGTDFMILAERFFSEIIFLFGLFLLAECLISAD